MTDADNGPLRSRSGFAVCMTDLMRAGGHSFRTLGAAVNADAGYLNKVANGTRPPPGPSLAAALDRTLRADGELVDLANREHAPPAPAGPRPLGETDAEQIRATTRHLVGLDTLHGSDGLTPIAVRAFRTTSDRLAVVGGTTDVRSALADLGAAAAWITSDDMQRDLSRAITLEALAQADLAGDTRMHRFLLSHQSMVLEHSGRYADALAYAEKGLAEATDNPRVNAVFQIRRARALSGLGGAEDALTAIDRAADLLTATPAEDDGLSYWVHAAELALHRAIVLARSNDRRNLRWAQQGLELLPAGQGRDQVLWRAIVVHQAVIARAWAEVQHAVDDLMQFVGSPRSARTREELDAAWELVTKGRVPAGARDAVRAARDAFTS